MKIVFTLMVCISLNCVQAYSNPAFNTDFSSPLSIEMLRTNLYIVGTDGTPTLVDGDLTQYDPTYSSAVDGFDARKMNNFSENIGMQRVSTVLVIERRHSIESADSIFYKIWNLKKLTYQLEFITSNLNHPGLSGYVEDNYLHKNTSLDLNGTNEINFSVTTDPGSYDPYRFRIIFSNAAARLLPLTFTSVKANRQNNEVNINWNTSNESNMRQYNIERSADGNNFSTLTSIAAKNVSENKYTWLDNHPLESNSYYRITATSIDGGMKNSEIVKINAKEITYINIFPNPVVNNRINLGMTNQPEGDYKIKLVNNYGELIWSQIVHHKQGTGVETVTPERNITKGLYKVEISNGANVKATHNILF